MNKESKGDGLRDVTDIPFFRLCAKSKKDSSESRDYS